MRNINIKSWPQAIAHLDADAFFVGVEQALHPELKGKSVITGAERGMVIALSYEAKACGVKRGMPVSEVTHICPDCILLPTDYESCLLFSKRIFTILKQYTPCIEEYSIDEGFFDLTGTRRMHHKDYKEIAKDIQQTIYQELGLSVSIGVSLSKSLAKLCSQLRKPAGITAVKGRHIHLLLNNTPLEKVWGFGPNTVALLQKHGLKTALDFVRKPCEWADRLLGKVGREIWLELQGCYTYRVQPHKKTAQASIQKMQTFAPASKDYAYVKARALRNLESACSKARHMNLAAKRLSITLRTQQFDDFSIGIKLTRASASPLELNEAFNYLFAEAYKPGCKYRATGITLAELDGNSSLQFGLFENNQRTANNIHMFEAVDTLANKFGKDTVFLADGLQLKNSVQVTKPERQKKHLPGENAKQRIGMPLLYS